MAEADAERGERIQWLRDRLHLTQDALADKVGVTLRAYQEWEAGGGIRWPNAQKLAKVGGVQADWIMSGDRGDTPDLSKSQMDRLEVEVAAIRVDIGTLSAQLAEMQRLLARMTKTASSQSRNRKAN